MSNGTLFWLLITLFCVFTQGVYSMLEMAAVTFNRVRLEYYVAKGMKRAKWLQFLLKKPSRLFGTIMLGVNIALQVGSQSSREFYRALNLDPNIAPLTQVFLVVIFAELTPLLAARKYAEHVVMLGIPIVYATYRLLFPVIWCLEWITLGVSRLFRSSEHGLEMFLSRDELEHIIESHEDDAGNGDDFKHVVSKIFALKGRLAAHVMTPLSKLPPTPLKWNCQTVKRENQPNLNFFSTDLSQAPNKHCSHRLSPRPRPPSR